jgi:IgA-specific serine endopeptidase
MSLTDPGELIRIIEELAKRLNHWSVRAAEHIGGAAASQRCAQECAQRMAVRAGGVYSRAIDDRRRVSSWAAEVTHEEDAAAERVRQAKAAGASAAQARSSADSAHTRWTSNLMFAQVRLARAESAESAARADLEEAKHALKEAQHQLTGAQLALSDARSRQVAVGKDREGKVIYAPVNTRPYEEAVAGAMLAAAEAQRGVADCEQLLRSAIAETRAARSRVTMCRSAIALADKARQTAADAATWASEADHLASLAQDEAREAGRCFELASSSAAAAIEAAEAVLARSRSAAQCCDEARTFFNDAQREGDAARNTVHIACQDMGGRVQALHEYDA